MKVKLRQAVRGVEYSRRDERATGLPDGGVESTETFGVDTVDCNARGSCAIAPEVP